MLQAIDSGATSYPPDDSVRWISALAPESLGPTVTVGEILVEIMADAEGFGFREPLALRGPYPSGAPAIFIDQCARIGGAAGIVAAVGDDDFGRVNLDRLAGDGVDVSAVTIAPDRPTGSAFVRYRPGGGRDFVFNIAHSAAGSIVASPAVERLIGRAGHIHVMGSALSMPTAWPIVEAGIARVKARGGTVSFDPNLRKELMGRPGVMERVDAVLASTDLFLPSEEEVFLGGPEDDMPAAIARLLARGVREVVVKRGARGASRHRPGLDRAAAAFPIREVDPTGAGDAFSAAYVTLTRLGRDPDEALVLANAAGARNATVRGPMEGLGTLADLVAFMAAHRRETA